MAKSGYRKEALIPSKRDGMPVYDPELDDYLRGMFGEKPTEQEAREAILNHRR